jgi:hypothetical protein
MRATLATLAVALIVAAPPAATAGNPGHGHGKKHHRHHDPVPVPTPTPTPAPVPNGEDSVAFCVSTTDGVSYLQLQEHGMDPGTYWRNLYDGHAVVLVAGRYIMFDPKGDAGITHAHIVPGIGSTC